mmetsp:Transcript_4760/g.8312  ORF Transcript_4760/g.8312 Transcript_4760/m.8312 type:complete len:110 (+) Transcript_4760:52-381(+)
MSSRKIKIIPDPRVPSWNAWRVFLVMIPFGGLLLGFKVQYYLENKHYQYLINEKIPSLERQLKILQDIDAVLDGKHVSEIDESAIHSVLLQSQSQKSTTKYNQEQQSEE